MRVSRRGSTSISTGSAGSIGGGATYYGNSPGGSAPPTYAAPRVPYYQARERNSPREAVDRALGKLSPTKQGDYSDAVSRLRAQHNVAYRNATRTVSRYSPRAEISSDPYASATAASSPFITSFLSSPQGEQPKPSSLSLEAARRIARGLPRGTAEQRPSTMRHETQYSVTYSPLRPANQSQIREADMVQKEVFTTKEDTNTWDEGHNRDRCRDKRTNCVHAKAKYTRGHCRPS